MDIIDLDPSKKLFGVIVDNKIYLASLCDLPNIIEGQKTLDFRTFYKSVDVSQILYVHNRVIEDFETKSPEELIKIAKDFNPVLEDSDFLNNLFRRSETKKNVEEMKNKGEEIKYDCLKFRHGIAPVAKNIRNIRHGKEPNEDPAEVHAVEQILKDIIDYGFADNVEEELLDFDDKGDLKAVIKGAKEKRKEPINGNLIQLDIFGDPSVKSESNYRGGNNQNGADGQSSMYSVPQDQDDGATSYRQDTMYNDTQTQAIDYTQNTSMDQTAQSIIYPQMQIQRGQGMATRFNRNEQNMGQQQQYYEMEDVSQNQNFSGIQNGVDQYNNQFSQFQPVPFNQHQHAPFNQSQMIDINNSEHQFQQQQPNQFEAAPIIYTYEDYQNMKQDLRELRTLIKQAKKDIEQAKEQGVEIQELRDYHRDICAQRDEIKAQKKIAKKQLKNMQQISQPQ